MFPEKKSRFTVSTIISLSVNFILSPNKLTILWTLLLFYTVHVCVVNVTSVLKSSLVCFWSEFYLSFSVYLVLFTDRIYNRTLYWVLKMCKTEIMFLHLLKVWTIAGLFTKKYLLTYKVWCWFKNRCALCWFNGKTVTAAEN